MRDLEKEIINPYGFIYITTNMVNGKKYIGQKMFRERWQSYLGSGKHFKRAIAKYGMENFIRDIVAIAYSKEELNQLEIEFINNHNAVESEDYYNIGVGGTGGSNAHAGMSQEEKHAMYKKIGEANREKQKGRTRSKEAIERMIESVSKKVICIITGEIFDSAKKASEFYNIQISGISKCCLKQRKTAGKMKWMFYEDYKKLQKIA